MFLIKCLEIYIQQIRMFNHTIYNGGDPIGVFVIKIQDGVIIDPIRKVLNVFLFNIFLSDKVIFTLLGTMAAAAL